MKRKQIFLLACVLLLLLALLASCKKPSATQINLTMVAGDGSADTVVQVDPDSTYQLPTPTRDGYEFAGWYAKADFSGDAFTSVNTDADITVYAKWEKLYTLTLDPAGGSLGTRTLRLKAGDSLADKLAALIPEKANSQFGTWMLYGEDLPADATMGAEDITLVAKYRVKYTVEIYLQNTARNGYDKSSDVITGYEYAGTAFTSAETVKGFSEIAKADSITRLVLSEDASQNVFRHYYDRAAYTLTFVSNYPDGSENDRKTEKLYYGVETNLPFVSFEMNGYYLEGWATTANGKPVYSSHMMDGKLFNGEDAPVETITADGNIMLYAVWSKGYTNLFGGGDILYVSVGEAKTVFLYRGDRYFKGMLSGKNIIFPDADVNFPQGVLNADGETFLFLDPSRAEISATLYETGKGLNTSVTLYLTSANGVIYSVKSEGSSGLTTTDSEGSSGPTTTDSEGEFVFDEDGNMVATFTSGPLKGQTLVMVIGQITVNGEKKTAFQVRNDDEINLGRILFFTVENNAIVVSTDDNNNPVGDITLNGFGIAAFNAGKGQITNFYYTYDAEKGTITLRNANGRNTYVLKLLTLNGELGYMIYNEKTDVTYDVAGGGTLSTDGMRTATFTAANGTTASGFFTTSTSAFGGTILTFEDIETGKVYVFMITRKTVQVPVDPTNPDGESKREVVTTVEQKEEGYAEFYYKDAAGTYYGPLFVFDSKDRTKATVYGYSKTKEYYKIAVGTLTYDEKTGTYIFTVTEHFDAPEGTEANIPLDFDNISSCVMMLDSKTTQYSIHFWFSYTNDVETVKLAKYYTGKNDSKLILVGGLAIYQINGKTEIGTYKQSGELTAVTFTDKVLYFYLNEEDSTYDKAYTSVATTYYEVAKDGTVLQTRYLVIDPRAGSIASFYVITGDKENPIITKYEGKITKTDKTSLTGFFIYTFTSNEMKAGSEEPALEFRFIQRSTSSTRNYIFVYDEAYAGRFTSTNTKNGVLTLDGFGFAATYSDGEGREVMGLYQKDGNNVTISGSTGYYFVLNGDECALRGSEYGKAYLVIDNQVFESMFAEFDGIGGAKLFTMRSNGTETERVDIDAAATYTIHDGVVTLVYNVDNEEHTLICRFGAYTIGSTAYNALNVLHNEVAYSYVNAKDWSVLRLNNDGTAIKYLSNGGVESGTYSLVTESLLYYVNSSATEAYIYVYDKETGTATPRSYSSVAYYTKDLDSLQFSQYGFAVFNNATRYYYTIDDEGNVMLYHLDENATNKNRYGYVEENFGKLEETKEYNGKSYFKNDGFAISFNREEGSKDDYPVLVSSKEKLYQPLSLLTFAPSGGETFSVNGKVTIGDTPYNCVVVKELQEDGTPLMYVRVGYHYFYITVNYQGDGVGSSAKSTYTVTGHSFINTMPSYTYLYYIYYISSMFGSSAANQLSNTFGTVTLTTIYKATGEEETSYLDGAFGKSSNFLDANGELIAKLEKAPLTYLGNNYYRAEFTGADGYNYYFIFQCSVFSVFNAYCYQVYGLIREETVTANDGYTMTVTRFITSDMKIETGSYFTFLLKKDGEVLNAENVILSNGNLYYVVKNTDENGKVTGTDYYLFTLTEKSSGSMDPDEEETTGVLPVYVSATVTKIVAETFYTADEQYYLDILPGNQIMMMVKTVKSGDETKTEVILIADCQYDAATGVYTLTASDNKTYTVTIVSGVATVTEVTEEKA